MSDELDDFGLGPFSKLFSSIVTSTIWRESDHVRIVWVTMLATCDKHGVVLASVPGLAAIANVTLENCLDAIDKLMSPDPWSRTKDFDGRRIEDVRGGWRLLNYGRYRDRDTAGASETRQQYGEGWYVYYVRDADEVKIGLSKNPWSRLKDHQTARPRCRLVGVERGDRALERDRHRQFADARIIEGPAKEWFRWTDEIARHVATVATEGRRSNEGDDVGATVSASASPSASRVDLEQSEKQDSGMGESAPERVTRFMREHDFGRFKVQVEGFLRSSRKPLAILAELELWLSGELNRKKTEPELLAEALNAYDAATERGEFKTNHFAGFVRGVHRGRDRHENNRRNSAEDRSIRDEERAAEQRRIDEADTAMLVAFERDHAERFAELTTAAEAKIDREMPRARKGTPTAFAHMVRDEVIRLVRLEKT